MAYEQFQDMTHKQLATIVTAIDQTRTPKVFENPDDMRDWARYYAECKKPWKPFPPAPRKKKLDKDRAL